MRRGIRGFFEPIRNEPASPGHAVDAAHMIGIVEPSEKGLEWNRRATRSLGRFAEALALQEDLARQWEEAEEKDGFVFEELAECLLALGREEEARAYFAQAYAELSKDTWLKENEPERLERIERLGQAR